MQEQRRKAKGDRDLKIFDTCLKYVLIVLMAVITVIGSYQVITRYVFNDASSWSEEAIRFLFIWISMLGSAYGVKEKAHVGIDFFINLCPKVMKKCAEYFAYLVTILFGIALVYLGSKLTMGTVKQMSPAIGIPMCYVYLALPVGGALTSYYALVNFIKAIKAQVHKTTSE